MVDGAFGSDDRAADTARRHRFGRVVVVLLSIVGAVGMVGCGRNDFVPYTPSADLVPALEDGAVVHLGGFEAPAIGGDRRNREAFFSWDPGPDASEWREVFQVLVDPDRSRVVSFATLRPGTRQEFDEQMDEFLESWSDDSTSLEGETIVELATLDGLPAGALTAHWPAAGNDGSEGWTTVVGDRDHQVMMVVAWVEDPEMVPTDSFVDVVNTAWSDFFGENTR